MKQKFLFIFFTLLFTFAKPVMAGDSRAEKVANFLATHNSPLAFYAPDFVREADKNGFDYRLLPAISGVDSTFAQESIVGTYTVYGGGAGVIYFKSWPDGIAQISAGLKEGYLDKGASDVEQIARLYCPPNSARWAANVRLFMNQIEATPAGTTVLTPAVSQELSITL